MPAMESRSERSLRIAHLVVSILDRGSVTQSYKYVTLLALLDVLVKEAADGKLPTVLHAHTIADRVLGIYWRHARPFGDQLLRHSAQDGAILDRIWQFQQDHNLKWYADMDTATSGLTGDAAAEWAALRSRCRTTVAKDPLPRLQVIGGTHDPFLYQVWKPGQTGWKGIKGPGRHDLHLAPDAALALLDTHMLIRPLIERSLLSFVIERSPLTPKESEVEKTLFGVDRKALAKLSTPLRSMNGNTCFYCGGKSGTFEVDHFLPWSFTRDDGVHNLVPAHKTCNGSKSNMIAAVGHLHRWAEWLDDRADDLLGLAVDKQWPQDRPQTVGQARRLYLAPAAASTPTWVAVKQTEPLIADDARSVMDQIAA